MVGHRVQCLWTPALRTRAPLQGPGSHQPSRQEGGGRGTVHCDLLLFRLYVRVPSITFYTFPLRSPACLRPRLWLQAAACAPRARSQEGRVAEGGSPLSVMGHGPCPLGQGRATRWFVTQVGAQAGGNGELGEPGALPVSRPRKGLCGPALRSGAGSLVLAGTSGCPASASAPLAPSRRAASLDVPS